MATVRPGGWQGLLVSVVLVQLCGGLEQNLELEFSNENQGFYLKPLYLAPENTVPRKIRRPFAVTNPVGDVDIQAKYGPYTHKLRVPSQVLYNAVANTTTEYQSVPIGDLDLSAHLVSRSITKENPSIQVLFHAQKQDGESSNTQVGPNSSWCLRVHASISDKNLSTTCSLPGPGGECLAQILIPLIWWSETKSHTIDVSYSVLDQCSEKVLFENNLSQVTLQQTKVSYTQIREDQIILIEVPQQMFLPGSRCEVPIRLDAGADVELFVMRAKAKHGIRVVGAESSDPVKWQVAVNINGKQTGGMASAYREEKNAYSKTDKVQDVFKWIFEVEEDDVNDTGLIMFNLDYRLSPSMKEHFGSTKQRVMAEIHIQKDNIQTIVAVVKTTSIQNTAILTGQTISFPVWVYAITRDGVVRDVTSKTTCHSGDKTVLKVPTVCNMVYVDGTESTGSSSVSVIIKYKHHTRFLFFKVWVPGFPLSIELSDDKLNQIKGWKVPRSHTKSSFLNRRTRGVEHESLSKGGSHDSSDTITTSCDRYYQQSLVQVYARFCVRDDACEGNLVHRKAYMKVTHLVLDKLRIADVSVASITGRVIQGQNPGRTEVQVLSKDGEVIGAKEIRVTKDKVSIDRLLVNVVSGVNLSVETTADLPGTLSAVVTVDPVLHKKFQNAFLDVNIKFNDGTQLPMNNIALSDYHMDLVTFNSNIVAFSPELPPNIPSITALKQGKGELLKLSLQPADMCQRRKTNPRTLAVSYVYVNIDFSKSADDKWLSDWRPESEDDSKMRSMGPRGEEDPRKEVRENDYGDTNVTDQKDSVMRRNKSDDEGFPNKKFGSDLSPDDDDSPEAQKQQIDGSDSLYIHFGTYIALALFCFLLVVLFVSGGAFIVYRHRRKRAPKEGREPTSEVHDWVWIGNVTLERNEVQTDCVQQLMSEEDFNGNQIAHSRNSASSSNRNSQHSNSNRNSVVSTYHGSECSIRITSNPLPEAAAAAAAATGGATADRVALSELEWDCDRMGMSYDQMVEYFDNLKETVA